MRPSEPWRPAVGQAGEEIATRAPAKVNLTLHVLGRRPDGYHELESLVAFAGVGDVLTLTPGDSLVLRVDGPTAGQAGPDRDNLVLKAARLLAERVGGLRLGAFRLTKRLPAAAGLGGGSSDAAAALRLLARANRLSLDDPAVREAARRTGADVPVCLEPRARVMRGTGEVLAETVKLPPIFAVLVNPGVPVETAAVFRTLDLALGRRLDRPVHPAFPERPSRDEVRTRIIAARNDLEPVAMRLVPDIGEALAVLRGTDGCLLARMSGSGATVFGLYDNGRDATAAAKRVRAQRPRWWVKATALR